MRRIGFWPLLVVLTGACLVAGGCGGDDAESSGDGGAQSDEAAAVERFVDRTAKIMRQARGPAYCKRLDPINARSTSRLACPTNPDLRKSLATFDTTGADTYGTGAVVDYTSGAAQDGASVILTKNSDGQWAITKFGLVYGKTVGTGDKPSRQAFDKAVTTLMRAVRDRNCKLYYGLTVVQPADPKNACAPDGGFGQTKSLARALRESPDPEPAYVGGNRAFGFYRLALTRPKPRHETISVVRTAPGSQPAAAILQVSPAPAEAP